MQSSNLTLSVSDMTLHFHDVKTFFLIFLFLFLNYMTETRHNAYMPGTITIPIEEYEELIKAKIHLESIRRLVYVSNLHGNGTGGVDIDV